MINSYLTSQSEIDDAAVHLLFSANRWEKKELLLRKLQQGTTLIVDRYAYSGVAFTSAKKAAGLDTEWCKAPDKGLPSPDIVFFLNISAADAAGRGGFGEERYERPAFQEEVLKQFEKLHASNWQEIDAGRSIEVIQDELREHTDKVIKECNQGKRPLQELW